VENIDGLGGQKIGPEAERGGGMLLKGDSFFNLNAEFCTKMVKILQRKKMNIGGIMPAVWQLGRLRCTAFEK